MEEVPNQELQQQGLQQIEQREGQLWLMAILVIMAFTVALMITNAPDLVGVPDNLTPEIKRYLISLPLLSCLFCAYVLRSSFKLRRIKGQLFETEQEKTQTQRLLETVSERSAELADLNEKLKIEIAEREQAEISVTQVNNQLANRERELLRVLERLKKSHEELKTAQLQLIQAAKLESVGRLAAGVAHEVKNPLATILLGTQYLTKRLVTTDEKVHEILVDIETAIKKADSVIVGLLDFSASQALSLRVQDLNPIVERSLLMVKYELDKYHVGLTKTLGEALPSLRLDHHKLEQVFVNIFLNAIHAMPEGGTLSVTTSIETLATPGRFVGWRGTDRFTVGEQTVLVEIEDTGVGIPEDQLSRIFDPFFTSRPLGKGTGLGLTVTRNIIDLHGGLIEILNRKEGGVKARIMFKLKI
jgi:signal transduction histidine kinase